MVFHSNFLNNYSKYLNYCSHAATVNRRGMPFPANKVDACLRAAGLHNYAFQAHKLAASIGETISIVQVARVVRDAGVPAPLISRGVQSVLALATVSLLPWVAESAFTILSQTTDNFRYVAGACMAYCLSVSCRAFGVHIAQLIIMLLYVCAISC